jgi:outer membrane protein TolC
MAREKMGFERLCGCDLEQVEEGYHEAIEDFDRSFDFFLRHHPGLRVLSAQMTMAQLERKRASGEGLPHLGGFAELRGGNPRNVVYDQWKVYVLAGLSFSIPVLNRSDIQRAMALSDLAERELGSRREATIAEGRGALQELYTALGSLQSRIPTLEKLANLRGEEVELKGKLLGAGQIAHAEYLDSLAARDRTLVLRQELDLQLEATRVAINAAIGRLEEEE